ncbi:SDR family oxidoreductase [Colwellia sp. 1_MG-2023]|uniref:SDR family oxidoreductase n=1 Tax=Colwellia sp. 1_MG-2023 TaxID=3062649 RepID=UPI0026E38023|nr:SDR family oxidoreductase [Colwellia sp. 1_MG-2023]MDO6447022.1 SDR family oxidoreductase [Colwellia sp. 1_MG-2023]
MEKSKTNVTVVGATGYLGKYVVRELISQGYNTTALVRSFNKINGIESLKVKKVDFLNVDTLAGVLTQTDVLISCLGITRQQDGFSYMNVDYQANLNVLEEAKKAGVKKVIYVSVYKGEHFKKTALCAAKEKFVQEVKKSGLEYCIVRPTGFFSDMADFFDMALKGKVYLFGDGGCSINPIHGSDLAKEMIELISLEKDLFQELNIGGPVSYTQKELAELAFNALRKPIKIVYIPNFFRRLTLIVGKLFIPTKIFGPIEFFLSLMSADMNAPLYGQKEITSYFDKLAKKAGTFK